MSKFLQERAQIEELYCNKERFKIFIFIIIYKLIIRIIYIKGSPDQSHFIFKTIVGKSRIRHKTIPNLNDVIFNRLLIRFNSSSLNFRVVACCIRPFPTLNTKMKWIWSELSLRVDTFSNRKFISGEYLWLQN